MEDGRQESEKPIIIHTHFWSAAYNASSATAASPTPRADPTTASTLSAPDFPVALALAELAAAEVALDTAVVGLAEIADNELAILALATGSVAVILLARLPARLPPVVALALALANAASKLPVTTPGPSLLSGVKYKLTADMLGNWSLNTVAAPVAVWTAVLLTLAKMSEKKAVGVPVQRDWEADVMIASFAMTSASERAPWANWQFRQPTQSWKKEPPHMHAWWAR